MGVPHRVFRHSGEVTSLEQAARERGQRPEQVIRSLVFRVAAEEFVMVLAPGRRQVSWKRLRTYLGKARLSLATPDEVFAKTGYRIGTVSPFGLTTGLRLLIDHSILEEEELSVGSGGAGVGIILRTESLIHALPKAEQVDLIEVP